jgi:7,8-dihydropterin-6-yl-methyl-4-(beta-D-ribofuranosyl)aminobenzene 5'-phosphate synthase
MKLTVVYDNTVWKKGLKSDWGFSCLVEADKTPGILFDTGMSGSILLSNMKKLNIDPVSIDEVFISHAHFDHTGGLASFLKANKNVRVYIPPSCSAPSGAKEVVYIKQPQQIHENVFSTGELDFIEQSMVIKTDRGLVIITGCSHPRMRDILKAASQFGKIYGIVGGLHGFTDFDLFKGMGLICPTHCTQHKEEIKSLYPETCVEGGAGKIIVI